MQERNKFGNKNEFNVGVIGCGSMGIEIIKFVLNKEISSSTLRWVYDQDKSRFENLNTILPKNIQKTNNIYDVLNDNKVDLIVEAASPKFVTDNCLKILNSGKSMMIMSSGALTDKNLIKDIYKSCKLNNVKVHIPSGAIGGIDCIKSVKNHLYSVSIKTTKSPEALLGAPGYKKFEKKKFTEPKIIFNGTATEAINLFPSNINISATISLAGLGPDKTKVIILADPDTSKNTHEISIESSAGNFYFKLENLPHPSNKRTSYLAILSAIETLNSIENTFKIGT